MCVYGGVSGGYSANVSVRKRLQSASHRTAFQKHSGRASKVTLTDREETISLIDSQFRVLGFGFQRVPAVPSCSF